VDPHRGTLAFVSEGGSLSTVSPSVLARMLGAFSPADRGLLEFVFLNGCCSYDLGLSLQLAGIPCVICWRTPVEDCAARIFSTAFFQSFRRCSSYEQAFEDAKIDIESKTRPGRLAGGQSSDVQKFELRAPSSPPRADLQGVWPTPTAAGVPVLLRGLQMR